MAVEFKLVQEFDPQKKRHYLNGELSVFHCHHYATLFTQLADDAEDLDGSRLLREAFEESTYPVLIKYYKENGITDTEEKKAVAEEYFKVIGFGDIKFTFEGDGGNVEMVHSHVDEGWIKKFGKRETPVNFMGQGFINAVFSAVTGNPPGSFATEETQSIVCGTGTSKFTVTKK